MASVRKRVAKGSGRATYAVLYRHGGLQTSRTFATRKAADDFAKLVDVLGPDRALKSISADDTPAISVAQLAEQFLARKARDVTERTLTAYRRDVTNWIAPWFGHRAAGSIDETDVQQWVDHMAETLAPKSVADRHMILHAMYVFGSAKSRRLVDHNPCLETELPRRARKRLKGTTVPEYRALVDAAYDRNGDAADLIVFLGETGWRWSEAAALPVHAVDDDGTSVWVDVTQVFRQDGRGRQVLALDVAKSDAGFRKIRLMAESAAVVRRRVTGKAPTDLVFTNSHGRRWNQNLFLRETWPRIATDAGLWRGPGQSPTPHWLRHMHVAVLAAMGVGAPEIRRRIGHESISTTFDVYGGMIGDMAADAVRRGDQIMAGARSAPTVAPAVVGEILGATA